MEQAAFRARLVQNEADTLKDAFYARCEKAGVKAEWRCNRIEHAGMSAEIVSQSLCADLIVMAQQEEDEFGLGTDLPSQVVLDTGRPVLP